MKKTEKTDKLQVILSYDLIEYLDKSMPRGTSRWTAYFYLLRKQKSKLNYSFEGGKKIPFLATVSELSTQWNWCRNSVFRFLDTLKKEGAIEVKQCIDGTLIRVLNIQKKTPENEEK